MARLCGRCCDAEPTRSADHAGGAVENSLDTFSGNRGLAIEEALIFEIGRTDTTGVDIDEPAQLWPRGSASLQRTAPLGLPGLSEPETMRHYVRLVRRTTASTPACSRSARAP